jgi:hypothetical protein
MLKESKSSADRRELYMVAMQWAALSIFITKQPTNKTEGFVELNFGNHGQQRYDAAYAHLL